MLCEQLTKLSSSDNDSPIIEQLTTLMADVEDKAKYEQILSMLTPAHRLLLDTSIEQSEQIKAPGPVSTSIFSGLVTTTLSQAQASSTSDIQPRRT